MMNILRIATLSLTAATLALPVGVFAAEVPPVAVAAAPAPSTAVASLEDRPEDANRAFGQIVAVDPDQDTFSLQTRSGDRLSFTVGERTRYRGEGIHSLNDLEPGMQGLVVWLEGEAGEQFALLVAARKPTDRPKLIGHAGEITGVVPGQGTFSLSTRAGQELEFSTSDRTRFRSRDGSVQDIHDLKKGMHALVGAVEREDGSLLALVVAVGTPQDRPDLDLRAVGRVIAVEGRSFTLQKRDGERLTVMVDHSTRFKGIDEFDQLEVGMLAAVGAIETDDGWLAKWVGAREPRGERDQSDPRPGSDNRPPAPFEPPAEQELSG